jgi:hypothetical protein
MVCSVHDAPFHRSANPDPTAVHALVALQDTP